MTTVGWSRLIGDTYIQKYNVSDGFIISFIGITSKVGTQSWIYTEKFYQKKKRLYITLFWQEYLQSQGIELNDPEEMPPDPYIVNRQLKLQSRSHKTELTDDKLRRFLEYDGKILRYNVAHDVDQL